MTHPEISSTSRTVLNSWPQWLQMAWIFEGSYCYTSWRINHQEVQTPYQIQKAQQQDYNKDINGWWTLDHKLMFPVASQWKIIKEINNSSHLGREALN